MSGLIVPPPYGIGGIGHSTIVCQLVLVTLYNGMPPVPYGIVNDPISTPALPLKGMENRPPTSPPCGIIALLLSHATSHIGISFPHDLPSLRDLRTPILIFCGVCLS